MSWFQQRTRPAGRSAQHHAGALTATRPPGLGRVAGPYGFATTGDLTVDVGGHGHSRIGGHDRTESGVFALQATTGNGDARAEGDVALDGHRVKLDASPTPAPFVWARRRLP